MEVLIFYMLKIMDIKEEFINTIEINDTVIQHTQQVINQDGLTLIFDTYADDNLILHTISTDLNDGGIHCVVDNIKDNSHIEIIEIEKDGYPLYEIVAHPEANPEEAIEYVNSIYWVNILITVNN